MSLGRCPCGGIILADTEDWPVPLCYECYPKQLVDKCDKAIAIIEKEIEISAFDSVSSTWARLTKGLLQLGEL